MVEIHSNGIGKGAEYKVHANAANGANEPGSLNVLEGLNERIDLSGEKQEGDVGSKNETDKLSALSRLLLVRVLRPFLSNRSLMHGSRSSGQPRLRSMRLVLGSDVHMGGLLCLDVVFGVLSHAIPETG